MKLSSLVLPLGGAAVVIATIGLYRAVHSGPPEGHVVTTSARAGGTTAAASRARGDDATPELAPRTHVQTGGVRPEHRPPIDDATMAEWGKGRHDLDPEDQAAADAVPAGVARPFDADAAMVRNNEMDEANKAYDRGDVDEAKELALKVLAKDDSNIRMRRIVISSACQLGDTEVAKREYDKLPKRDQTQMQRRCAKFGVTFEPAAAP